MAKYGDVYDLTQYRRFSDPAVRVVNGNVHVVANHDGVPGWAFHDLKMRAMEYLGGLHDRAVEFKADPDTGMMCAEWWPSNPPPATAYPRKLVDELKDERAAYVRATAWGGGRG